MTPPPPLPALYTDVDLPIAVNQGETTLSGNINDVQTTIGVTSIADFNSDGGYAWIISTNGTTPGEELIYYLGASGSNLTGVTRGHGGTSALNADSGDSVEVRVSAEMHNDLQAAVKALSASIRGMLAGTTDFHDLTLSDDAGTIENGFTFDIDTATGEIFWNLDTGDLGADLTLRGGTGTLQTELLRITTDGSDAAWATDVLKMYVQDQIDVGGQLWGTFDPTVANGAGNIAFELDSVNDLANATASVLQISNNGSSVFNVRKAQTEAPKFKATGSAAFMSGPILSSDPGTPQNGDMWIYEPVSGNPEIRVRIGGSTYGVALT